MLAVNANKMVNLIQDWEWTANCLTEKEICNKRCLSNIMPPLSAMLSGILGQLSKICRCQLICHFTLDVYESVLRLWTMFIQSLRMVGTVLYPIVMMTDICRYDVFSRSRHCWVITQTSLKKVFVFKVFVTLTFKPMTSK